MTFQSSGTSVLLGKGVRDDTKHATEVELASRNLLQATSEAEADTHLTEKEALTNAFSNKDRTNQNWLEQNLYSSRLCEGEDGVQQRIQPCHVRNGRCGAH